MHAIRVARSFTGKTKIAKPEGGYAGAHDYALQSVYASEEALGDTRPSDELMALEGMTGELAWRLAANGIATVDDLGEQSIDDLLDIEGIDDAAWAADVIMKAREPWFAAEAQEAAE